MNLLDERSQVRGVAQAWREQYGEDYIDKNGRNVWRELAALDVETATAEQVAEITGQHSRAYPRTCDECGTERWDIVELGYVVPYEQDTAKICADCLRKALALTLGVRSE